MSITYVLPPVMRGLGICLRYLRNVHYLVKNGRASTAQSPGEVVLERFIRALSRMLCFASDLPMRGVGDVSRELHQSGRRISRNTTAGVIIRSLVRKVLVSIGGKNSQVTFEKEKSDNDNIAHLADFSDYRYIPVNLIQGFDIKTCQGNRYDL